MEIAKKLDELKREVEALQRHNPSIEIVGTGRGGRILRKDYVMILAKENLKKMYGSLKDIPVNLKFRFTFQSPQLAEQYSALKPEQQEEIWNSPEVYLTEKIMGVRGTLIYSPKMGWSCYGREMDSYTYIYIDYINRVLPWTTVKLPEAPLVLDTEIVLANKSIMVTLQDEMGYSVDNEAQAVNVLLTMDEPKWLKLYESYQQQIFKYKLIDVYHYNKKDVRKLPYSEREQLFDTVCKEMNACGYLMSRPKICRDVEEKKAFHEGILNAGGEGTIAVFSDKPCNLTGNRKKDEWVKIKRSVFNMDTDAMDDTVDVWVDKIKLSKAWPGLVEAAKVCAEVNGKEKCVAIVRHIPLSMRQVELWSKNAVCELMGSSFNGVEIKDPIFVGFRTDKSQHDCVINY